MKRGFRGHQAPPLIEGLEWRRHLESRKPHRPLLDSGLADECLRMLLEPAEEPGDPGLNLARIEAALDCVSCPRLLHGLEASAWEFVKLAAERGYDTRTGFEDTLTLPDGSPESNARWSPLPGGSLRQLSSS